ncbi:hypothetical protein [Paenibacillus sp. 32352]|uniref:hypothetical protein n=1 Tax=Paenibacillus sp. 32352 TaxID=1969111 RepID=UPI0009ACD513|nr:hypothetical protein [Paenibacillus sp. 32352]
MYFSKLQSIVKLYADAYNETERFQKENSNKIPKGDQKTGVFGEAFILEYIYKKYGNAFLTQHGSTSKDIRYYDHYGLETYVEVKTVSAFSEESINDSHW